MSSKRIAAHARDAVAMLLIGAVRAYQWLLSPWLGPRCRHLPTCSGYAIEAIRRFGPVGGTRLALARIARCHPWGTWGYDPVPDSERQGPTTRRRAREL